MQFHKANNTYILILNRGEHVIESITAFCKRERIQNAHFSAMGAVDFVTCGYYDLGKKEYFFKDYDQMLEVVSATGNVMLKENEPLVHLHAVFTDTNNTAFGGHVKEMSVGVTLEIMLTPLESTLQRQLDDDIGLYLINCEG